MILLKTEDALYDDMDAVNKKKYELIIQYLTCQDQDHILYEDKIENTKKLFYELRKCNDQLTELECEYVALLSFQR